MIMKKDNFVQLDSYDTNIPRQDDDEVGGKVEEKELLATMPNKASKDCTNSAEGQGTRAHLSHGCVKPISVRLAAPAGLAKDDEVTEKQIEIEDDEENTTQDSKEEKMSGLGKDDRVVPQTSLSRSQARCHPSLPGAHAVTGPEAEEEISRQQQRASQNLIETIISASTASPRPPPCRSPSPSTYASPAPEMVEARKVQDLDCPQNIPSAEPVFHDCNTKVQPSRKKRTPVLYTFIALALALAIGIGIAFCLRKDEDTDTSSTNSNHQSPTASPTQAFTYHAETMNLPESTLDAIIFGSELDPKTPQSRAYDWLMNDPFLADYPPWRQVQRFALTTFYYATGGEKWKLQKDWLSYNVSECQWYFRTLLWSEILIGSPTHVLNVGQLGQSELQFADRVCNEAGRYLHLVFAENNMKGFLPPEIALLNSLEVLDIGGNEFMIGSIPTEIGLLTRLTSFYAGYNSHTGHIPTEIGMLTRLEEIDIGYSPFTGQIPTEFGSLADSLRILVVRRSPDLTGALPTEIYLLTNLEILLVQANVGLSEGTLSSEIGKLSKLQRFATHDIPFKGTIPSEIGLLSDLYLLNMWNCQLFSTVPDELWQLTNLQMLDLDDNDLSGTFPSGLGNLRNLTQAYLNGNQFSGTLPAGIFEHLGKLSVLSVYKLLLTGTVPTEVGLLTSLKTNFLLAENDFTGTIPSELGLLSNVGIISLHATSLSGTLPSELLRLTNLEVLSVSDTSLTGSIPDGLCGRIYDLEFSCLDTNYETELVLCTGIKAVNFSCSASLLCGCNCDACT